jgi:cyclophilin family peptidyl-prolyl cis-trans isomerase
VYFFRVGPNFVVQFGLSGDTAVGNAWRGRRIPDDSVRRSNVRGTVSYARSGASTRTVQLFINLRDNARLDTDNTFGFAPIGQIVQGMDVVDSLHSGYGEAPTGRGGAADSLRRGPAQNRISREGNAYLRGEFPLLDRIIRARVVREWRRGSAGVP